PGFLRVAAKGRSLPRRGLERALAGGWRGRLQFAGVGLRTGTVARCCYRCVARDYSAALSCVPLRFVISVSRGILRKIGLQGSSAMCKNFVMAETEKNAAAVALGRLGGLKGGKARARKLTPQQRAESARGAALARWAKNLRK